MQSRLSRSALVDFFNDILALDITKIDELGNGAAYCQLLDSIYGDVPMSKVKFDARSTFEMQSNHKILQQMFLKHKIPYDFDSLKLMKCRLQDNLEFSQWIHQFWQSSKHIPDYDPTMRRAGKGNTSSVGFNAIKSVGQNGGSINGSLNKNRAQNMTSSSNLRSNANLSSGAHARGAGAGGIAPRAGAPPQPAGGSQLNKQQESIKELQQTVLAQGDTIRNLEEENFKANSTVEVLHQERFLYYEKLVDIESLVGEYINKIYQEDGAEPSDLPQKPEMLLIRKIQNILYSTPEGFLTPSQPEDEPF